MTALLVWEWVSNFSHCILDVITYPMLGLKSIDVSEKASWLINRHPSVLNSCILLAVPNFFMFLIFPVFIIKHLVNTLSPRQNERHFADDTFKCIFLKENVSISIKISRKFVPKNPIDNISGLFQIMAWRRPGDKPLSEAMMVSLLMHICFAQPQWVKIFTEVSNLWVYMEKYCSLYQIKLPLSHAIIYETWEKKACLPTKLLHTDNQRIPCYTWISLVSVFL